MSLRMKEISKSRKLPLALVADWETSEGRSGCLRSIGQVLVVLTFLIFSFETNCRSRTVDPLFQALAGATPRGSLAAFLWPTARLPRRFRCSPARLPLGLHASGHPHRGSGVGSEQVGHCSWHPLLFFGRVRASVILGSVGGRVAGACLVVLKVLDQLTKAFDGLSIKPGFL